MSRKVAVVVFADTEGGEALGRVVNALSAAREFKQGGDNVKVVFTGAGTKWVGKLAQPDNQLHAAFQELREQVAGACGYCADAFGVTDSVQSACVPRLEEFGTSMSFRRLVEDGYQVLTF